VTFLMPNETIQVPAFEVRDEYEAATGAKLDIVLAAMNDTLPGSTTAPGAPRRRGLSFGLFCRRTVMRLLQPIVKLHAYAVGPVL
jgi:hypothetical protein